MRAGPVTLATSPVALMIGSARVDLIHLANTSATERRYTVAIGDDAAGARIYSSVSLPAHSVADLRGPFNLDSDQPLTVYADGSGVTATVQANGGQPVPERVWSGAQFLGPDFVVIDREGDQSNSEQQGYEPSNVFVNGSNYLEIVAEKVTSHGHPYRSGMIQWASQTFTHGRLKIRAKLPAGTGPWPALWFLGRGLQAQNVISADDSSTAHWPLVSEEADEIDLAEMLGALRTSVNFQIHADFGSGTQSDGGSHALGFDASADFHTYEIVRASGSLTLFVDDVQRAQITTHVSDTPMFLIINLAVGGTGGGPIVDGTLPVSLLVDYVRMTP